MERVKSRMPHDVPGEGPAPKPATLRRSPGSDNIKDSFEPEKSLRKSPPSPKSAVLISRAREPLKEFAANQAKVPAKLSAKVEEARAELAPDSRSGNTRMIRTDYGAFEGSFAKYVVEILKGAGKTGKALNEMKTGQHLGSTLEHNVESQTIRPVVERLKANQISQKQAQELLNRASAALMADPTVQQAIKDIDQGEKATDVVANQVRKLHGGKRSASGEPTISAKKGYSLENFITSKFDQLMKTSS